MNIKKKLTYLSIFILFIASVLYLSLEGLKVSVPKKGGSINEAVTVGPKFLNPLLSTTDTDKSISYLVYSPLLQINEFGEISKNSLADSYEVSEDKREYTINLKKDLYFHDNEKLTVRDVIFTVNKAQDPVTKSCLIRRLFGIETLAVDDYTVKFTLINPSYNFLENLNLRIIPRHIWDSVPTEEISFSNFNLNPIGSGPYEIDDVIRNESGQIEYVTLKSNKDYFETEAFIERVRFSVFGSQDSALDALKSGHVNSFGGASLSELKNIKIPDDKIEKIHTSRLFSIFFNLENETLLKTDTNVKDYVKAAIANKTYLENILGDSYSDEFSSLPLAYGYGPQERQSLDLIAAKEKLNKEGWEINAEGFYEKKDELLEIDLATPDSKDLINIATEMENKLMDLGVKVNLKVYDTNALQDEILRDRKFEALLFGMQYDSIPSLYPFWHSFSIDYPGINISGYSNSGVDLKIENLQSEFDKAERSKLYREIVEEIDKDSPISPLYSPLYIYSQTTKIIKPEQKDIITSPEERFYGIEKWHTKSEKILKIFNRN